MGDVLARICADKRLEVDARKRLTPLPAVRAAARDAPPVRPFAAALRAAQAGGGFGLIAEFKRASPSKGPIRPGADPDAIARAYAAGGAACLSVLTETKSFAGADADLIAARAAVDLPVLRKDFLIDSYQVIEARAIGADCVLVILAAVDDALAAELTATALALGMDVLAEVHDEGELARALALPATLIGVNNRNLKTLAVDLATTEALAPRVPSDRHVVGESGLASHADLQRLARCGVRSFLVGEGLMRQPDVADATRTLLGG